MKRDPFIHENGKTLTPQPIYPREIKTPSEPRFKEAEIPTPSFINQELGERLFDLLVAPRLKKFAQS